jgi:hypothetical protein
MAPGDHGRGFGDLFGAALGPAHVHLGSSLVPGRLRIAGIAQRMRLRKSDRRLVAVAGFDGTETGRPWIACASDPNGHTKRRRGYDRRHGSRGFSVPVIERRRLMILSSESCESCRKQLLKEIDALPHARLMIVSSTPVIESFGGGVETRYICLDCGYTITHSTGRFGKGWH